MDTISVQTMVTNVRTRTNKERSRFVTDAEIVLFLQAAWRELYDVLTNTSEDYNLTVGTPFVLGAGESTAPLPDDFYKLRGVDFLDQGSPSDPSAQWRNVRRFTMQQRNARTRYRSAGSVVYQLRGDTIAFSPPPDTGTTLRILYVPRAPRLTLDTVPASGYVNEIDAVNGYDAFLELKASIQVRVKEEASVTDLTRQADGELQRIIAASSIRDAAESVQVTDVNNVSRESDLYY